MGLCAGWDRKNHRRRIRVMSTSPPVERIPGGHRGFKRGAPSIADSARSKRDPIVSRLLKNSNWEPAARAAIAYFLDNKECGIPSWRRSSTWQQVQMAFDEINQQQ